MPRKNLTASFVESVTVEARKDFWDDKVRGLVLRVTPNGVKTWNAVYVRASDGSKQRATLGRFPAITLERARAKALKVMSAVAEGEDPADKKRADRASMTVQQLGELFIEKYAKRRKKTWAQDERILKADVYPAIGKTKAMSVRRRDIIDIIEAKAEAGKGAASTNVLAVVRKMFSWAVDGDYLPSSPVTGVKPRSKPVRRDRVLSDVEIVGLWKMLQDAALSQAMADVIWLLVLAVASSADFLRGTAAGYATGIAAGRLAAIEKLRHFVGEVGRKVSDRLIAYCVTGLTSTEIARIEGVPDRDIPAVLRQDLRACAEHFHFIGKKR